MHHNNYSSAIYIWHRNAYDQCLPWTDYNFFQNLQKASHTELSVSIFDMLCPKYKAELMFDRGLPYTTIYNIPNSTISSIEN